MADSRRNTDDDRSPEPKSSIREGRNVSELVKDNIVFTLGAAFLSGAAAILISISWIDARVKIKIDEKLEEIDDAVSHLTNSDGITFIFSESCPPNWVDFTAKYDGLLLSVDSRLTGDFTVSAGDGSHEHNQGAHSHSVTGRTGPLGGGERRGRANRDAAHESNTAPVTGTAHPAGSEHVHRAGGHKHASLGVRLCRPPN